MVALSIVLLRQHGEEAQVGAVEALRGGNDGGLSAAPGFNETALFRLANGLAE